MKTKLIIDASSQIPVEFAQSKNIAFIEQLIDLEGEYRKEVSEVNLEDFVSKMRKLEPLPKTTLGSPQHVLDVYEQVIEEGYKEAVYLYVTPKLSNQISTAKVAHKKVKDKLNVHFFATGHAGPSQAPFGLYALKLIEKGKSVEEIMNILERLKPLIYTIGVSSSLKHYLDLGK